LSAAVCLAVANKLFFLSTELVEDEVEALPDEDVPLTTFCEAVSHAESNDKAPIIAIIFLFISNSLKSAVD